MSVFSNLKAMKRIVLFLSILLIISAGSYFAYADQPNKGNAKHKESLRDRNIDRADDTYEDLKGKEKDTEKDVVSISFTSDMDNNMELYSRVGTYFKNDSGHYPRSFLLDAGNYSDAFPYKMIFRQNAPGLRLQGAAGYDISGLGVSEIEQGNNNLKSMLNRAVSYKETVPYVTIANVAGTGDLEKAYKNYGVNDYQDLNKYRTELAVFSVIGKDAFESVAPEKLTYSDAVTTAKNITNEIKEDEEADIVVCFCHSGSESGTGGSLETELARKVKGIDIIISTGESSEFNTPKKIGNTRIFSLEKGAGNLGRIKYKIKDGAYSYDSFEAVKLDDRYKKSAKVEKVFKKLKRAADKNFFAANGFMSGQVLASSFFEIAPMSASRTEPGDSPMGEFISDAYKYAAIEDVKIPVENVIGIASDSSSEGDIPKGKVTVNDIHSIMSSGQSEDGTEGMALSSFYLTGKDVVKLAEIAAISFEDESTPRLYMSGVDYKYNPHRFKDSRIYDMTVSQNDMGDGIKIKDKELYRFVSDTETCRRIKELESYENEDLRIKVRGEKGKALDGFSELKRNANKEMSLKTWVAVSEYVSTFNEAGISASYRKPDGRMVYDDSKAFSHVYKGELFTLLTMLLVALIGVAAFVLLILLILNLAGVKRIRKPKPEKDAVEGDENTDLSNGTDDR